MLAVPARDDALWITGRDDGDSGHVETRNELGMVAEPGHAPWRDPSSIMKAWGLNILGALLQIN